MTSSCGWGMCFVTSVRWILSRHGSEQPRFRQIVAENDSNGFRGSVATRGKMYSYRCLPAMQHEWRCQRCVVGRTNYTRSLIDLTLNTNSCDITAVAGMRHLAGRAWERAATLTGQRRVERIARGMRARPHPFPLASAK